MIVQLRPVENADIPALFEIQSDQIAVQMAVVFPRSREDFEAHWERIFDDQDCVARSVLVDDTVVGNISCFKMDDRDSVGYWIAREHWGRGIATRALELLLEEVSTRPLWARVARENTGSIRVLEKCGFEISGYQTSPADGHFPVCEEAILQLK